ncbi:hypothetical protein L5515_011656 [Caenorhabditis briggsae]|uniref:Leishmanolysin-like peptidase n=1 Tax=Caenorhabditis briggsae TaxID=6238 RepID=A0AAE9EQH0_CAEBR|nr:hypothetical protein L5515_011656 [Caenorhabditis briggsae]
MHKNHFWHIPIRLTPPSTIDGNNWEQQIIRASAVMQIRCLLIPLLLASAISCTTRRGLKIVAVNKDGTFPDRIQKSWESALKWFENAILIEDKNSKLTFAKIKQVIGYTLADNVGKVTIQTPNKLFSLDIESPDFEELFDASDMLIFIREKQCAPSSRPSATGSHMKNSYETFSKRGMMQWCYHEEDPEFPYFDLIRHEILHILGFGTENFDAPQIENYQWKNEDNTVSQAKRYFFKTKGSTALDEVKKHFGCDNLKGVESDIHARHLNEYIFHNELMTPFIQNGKNYLSWISVALIENIYGGQVYHVDKKFVAAEADSYSFGKGFGCSWLTKSCHEFLEERTDSSRPVPFCPKEDNNALTIKCFKTAPTTAHLLNCREKMNVAVDNGIPFPANSKYQNPFTRFCPIYTDYERMLSEYPLSDCNKSEYPE